MAESGQPSQFDRPSRHDRPELPDALGQEAAYYGDRDGYDWRTRLSMMWRMDEWGMPSPELANVRFTTEFALMAGASYGAFHESAKVQRIFLEQNKYTMFQHPREAQKAMQDRIVMAMLQGGWRAGWRMGVLGFTFSAVSQSLTAVRNYVNPLDYAVAGGVMGAVYKVQMGPRGMVGAGLGGALLGLQGGLLAWLLQRLSGLTVAERWHMDFQKLQETGRQKSEKKASKDNRAEHILTEPDVRVADEGSAETGMRRLIVTVRRWQGEEGLADPAEEAPLQALPQLEASPGLETLSDGHDR